MALRIIDVTAEHAAEWGRLFDGYNVFYGRTPSTEVTGTVWRWLQDPAHELEGVLALDEGTVVGLAHFRRMPSPGRGCDVGWLDDLFVAHGVRDRGVGRALIEHVRDVGEARGWPVVRWTTADDNYRARSLYDTLGRKTMWNVYEMTATSASRAPATV